MATCNQYGLGLPLTRSQQQRHRHRSLFRIAREFESPVVIGTERGMRTGAVTDRVAGSLRCQGLGLERTVKVGQRAFLVDERGGCSWYRLSGDHDFAG